MAIQAGMMYLDRYCASDISRTGCSQRGCLLFGLLLAIGTWHTCRHGATEFFLNEINVRGELLQLDSV